MNKGDTLDTCLKAVEKKADITPLEQGLIVTLHLHVKHYTKLYFDIHSYIASLTDRLQLQPTAIKLIPDTIDIIEKQHIPMPVPIPTQTKSKFIQ
jgi:hypothetical protein